MQAERQQKSGPEMPSATVKAFYLTSSKMGSLWKVWIEELQNLNCICNGAEASLQGAGCTLGA